MASTFWEQTAFLFITETRGLCETSSAHTGTLKRLYAFWAGLSEDVRATAHLRLNDRSLLEADEIGSLASRPDFPSRLLT